MAYLEECDINADELIPDIIKDPSAGRPYLFSDEQNMYNQVVLVSTVNIYMPASLDRRPVLRYQVLQVGKQLYSHYVQSGE